MTREEVRAAARRVTVWHARFAPLFGRKEAREHSEIYVKGLLSGQERKSIEPLALQFARRPDGAAATQNEVVALQGFITYSLWKVDDVFREIRAVFAEELMPTAGEGPIGTVGVIDESGFVKAGTESAGVAQQWCGRLGKSANCQVGVVLAGVTPGGTAFLDAQLFLTKERAADKAHRKKTRVPKKVKFQTKPEIAAEMIRRTLAAGKVHFDWITADQLYGSSGDFLDAPELMEQRYVVEVKKDTIVWTVDPATLPGAFPGPKARRKIGCYRIPKFARWRRWRRACPPRPGNRSSCGKAPRVRWSMNWLQPSQRAPRILRRLPIVVNSGLFL
ncbi:MAG: IS701 family transposase [Thermoguttaceae bacterium]|jgi:SRSO17 transposase